MRRKRVTLRRSAVRVATSVPNAAAADDPVPALLHERGGRQTAQPARAPAAAAAGQPDDHAARRGSAAQCEAVLRAVARDGGRAHAHAIVIVKFAGRLLLLLGLSLSQFRYCMYVLHSLTLSPI